jgi:hypothetical protein
MGPQKRRGERLIVAAVAAAAAMGGSALGCVKQQEDPPWMSWQWKKEQSPLGPDFVRQSLYMNIGLFPFSSGDPEDCACGFAYSGSAFAAGAIQAVGMSVVVWDLDTNMPVAPVGFDLAASATTTSVLNDAGAWDGTSANGQPLNWFGFSGSVNPFTPPSTTLGQAYAICFTFDVLASVDADLKQRYGWVGAGHATSTGIPIFTNDPHPFDGPFNGANIPGPGALALLAVAAFRRGSRRRAS